MLAFCLLKMNYTALVFFILFALIFIGLMAMYIYSFKLKRKAKNSVGKFSHDLKSALDGLSTVENKLSFLKNTERRILNEKKYEKNPEGRKMLLSKVYQHEASVLFQANRLKEAVKSCSRVLEVEPSHIQTYLNRGSLYGELGKYEQAIADFNQVELIDSQNPNVYNNRGWMYLQLGECEKALSDFDYAISLHPTDVEYYNRANTYQSLGEWAKALSDFQMSLSLNKEGNAELRPLIEAGIAEMGNKLQNSSN